MSRFARLVLMLSLAWLQPCFGDALSEGRVKSAYVLNFARFVEWPADAVRPDEKMTLCVLGRDVLGGALRELDGRKAGARELRVVEYAGADGDLGVCDLVYIGESVGQQAAGIVRSLRGSPRLIISDIGDFAGNGGSVGLLKRGNRVVFEVNLEAVKRSGLHLPSQLLNLAAYVYER